MFTQFLRRIKRGTAADTSAAHDLCTGIPAAKKTHQRQLKAGDLGVFYCRRWQTDIYPNVKALIRAQG
jgi:poly(3-hydroxybutyrate) depolymerase